MDDEMGEEPPAEQLEARIPTPAIDPVWAGRLSIVAAACALATIATVVGAAISAMGLDLPAVFDDGFRQKIQVLGSAASVGTGLLVVVGGLALAGARHLGGSDRSTEVPAYTLLGGSVLIGTLAIVGAGNAVLGESSVIYAYEGSVSALAEGAAVLVLAVLAGWLAMRWQPEEA